MFFRSGYNYVDLVRKIVVLFYIISRNNFLLIILLFKILFRNNNYNYLIFLMVLYKVNTDLMYNYSYYYVDCHRLANLEKTFLMRKIVTKF